MIRLHTLGALDLRTSESEAPISSILAQPRRVALLAYLALAGRPGGLVPRDALLALFWPENSDERARRSLNQALYFLRRRLGPDAVVSMGGQVGLSGVWCDGAAFQTCLEEGRSLEALQLYRGELLPAFHIDDAPGFSRWLEEERARLSRLALEAALQVARRYAADRNPVEAVRWLRQGRELAPYDEALLLELVQVLAAAGDRAGIIQEVEAFRHRLRNDLDLEPSPSIETAIRGLEAAPRPVPSPVGAHPAPSSVAAPPTSSPPAAPTAAPDPGPAARRGRMRAVGGVALLALAGTAAITLFMTSGHDGPGRPLDEGRILVADFTNLSDDPAHDLLGRVASDWLIQDLAQAGILSPVPLAAMLREARRLDERGEVLDAPARAMMLAEETGAGLLLTGSVLELEGRVVLRGQVVRVSDGKVLRTVEAPPIAPDDALDGVRDLSRQLLGSLATLVNPRLARWSGSASQPMDLEAYRLYAAGLDALFDDRRDEALELLLAAGSPEDGFTAPLLWAVRLSTEVNRMDQADSILGLLEPWRSRLRPWDSAMFDYYAAMVRGRWKDMVGPAERLVAAAPDSEWLLALANAYLQTNRPAAALEVHARLDPDRGWIRDWPHHWTILTEGRHRLGDYEGELADLERWRSRDPAKAQMVELRALAALGRLEEFRQRLDALLMELPNAGRVYVLLNVIDELEVHGQGGPAAAYVARLDTMAGLGAVNDLEDPVARSRLLSRLDRYDEAVSVLEALGENSGDHVIANLGLVAARRGARAEALRLEERLASLDGRITRGWSTMQRAMIRAVLNDRAEALELMSQAMDEGHGFYPWMHAHPAFANLRGWPPYEAFMRPRG